MDYFDKNYHAPGTPPGTLVERDLGVVTPITIHLIDYTSTEYTEKQLVSPDECQEFLSRKSITWVHIQGSPNTQTLNRLGDLFKLHPLAMEDILNHGQRPKIEDYDEQLFTVLSLPLHEKNTFVLEQFSLFLGKNYLISFHNGSDDIIEPLRARLRKTSSRIRTQSADYLLYCLLDLIIDQGFPLLDFFGEYIEAIEEELLNAPDKNTLANIHALRRELLLLRRALWPQREVINFLMREKNLMSETTLIYLRDCYDHVIQIIDLVENYREMAASMIDVYLSSVSHRLNEIMRVLTVIATIFIPLTFVTGIYGMNFHNPNSPWSMPELGWYYGYPLTLGVMVIIVIGMLAFFKRKNWF